MLEETGEMEISTPIITLNGREKAWLVGADMGYGHLRALYPLRSMAYDTLLIAGKNDGANAFERQLWLRLQTVYERLSRARGIPVVGKTLFQLLNSFLEIPSFYPIRNLSKSTFQVRLLESFIRQGLCAGVLAKTAEAHLPLVTSFYAPAIAADRAGMENVYCIVCDADLNRVWVTKHPWDSRITYFVPCGKAAQRLRAYGVEFDRIKLTGFPLPEELLGGPDLPVLKVDLARRLRRLDPKNRFWPLHQKSVEHFLGETAITPPAAGPLTITFAVGGAGAQKEFGGRIMKSLVHKLAEGTVVLNLVAGVRREVQRYFELEVSKLPQAAAQNVSIFIADEINEYFLQFQSLLHTTDILWTKPSELSFYCALGIPFIISPDLGSQEVFNRQWLLEIQAGVRQENPDFTHQWLFDMLENGRFAEMAWSGFLKARKLGTYKIREYLHHGRNTMNDSPLLR